MVRRRTKDLDASDSMPLNSIDNLRTVYHRVLPNICVESASRSFHGRTKSPDMHISANRLNLRTVNYSPHEL